MSGKKVLVVEDNPNNLQLFQIILKRLDVEVLTATDGEEALRTIKREKPDLVVLDIQIPGISGLDVLAEIRGTPDLEGILVIAVTAYAMQGDKEKILAAGANHYLSKPINTREFPKIVEKMLAGEI
ncbi:MAG: response regulator [Promethearchaeota archaeon]